MLPGHPAYPNPMVQPDMLGNARAAYGVWDAAMKEDPQGNLVRVTVQNAAVSAAIFAVVGLVLPKFTAVEGMKWGALIGAARGAWEWSQARKETVR